MNDELKVSLGQASDRGVKERNEDFFGALIPEGEALEAKGIACVLADGMGSCELAAEASEECVKAFLSDYYSTPDTWSVKQSGGKVLTAINNWLLSQGRNDTAQGMVTTFDALVLKSTTAHIFHVGDARVQRLRGQDFECLTHDHRVRVSRERDYLSRAMGIDSILDIDYRTVSLQPGDLYLMTTDGVHDFVPAEQLKALLGQEFPSLDAMAEAIVQRALERGSQDNVTAQIVRIDALPPQDANEVFKRLAKLPFPPHLGPGMTMDGYEILEEIHASTTSQLYRVRDIESGEELVMKTPSVNFEDDPAYIERFYMEEWVGKRIDSPLVVGIRNAERPRNFLYYVMERVEGITLRQWMERNPDPDIDEVVELVEKIIAGVRVFHRLEMLHRDLKPENIIITPSQGIRIIDFGSVKIGGIEEISTPVERVDLLGTKNYTAPEYLLGSSGDTRSDLFSVGVMAYEMLTGHLPYGDRLTRDLSWKSLGRIPYESAIRHNPMLPLWMDGALEKAVRLDARQRYEHFSEFLFDLKNPNPLFMNRRAQPLMERSPLRAWQLIAGLSVALNLVLLYLLSQ